MSYFDQKKYEWGKLRWGMFTGSIIQDILEKGKDGLFGKGAMTRIEKVACEAYTEYEPNEFDGTWAMREGKRKEPESAKFYSHIMSGIEIDGEKFKIEYFGESNPNFKPYDKYPEHAGVSSDMVLFLKNNPYLISEFKCPTRDIHFDRLRKLKQYNDDIKGNERYLFLKQYCKEYYAQIQFNMMCWKVNLGHWVSYNEFFPMDERMIIIEVPADKSFQLNLNLTLALAIQEKIKIIEELKNK